jgi:hypothetical protein
MMIHSHVFTVLFLLAGVCKQQELQQGKTLVACSTRDKDPMENEWARSYHGDDKLDLSYGNRPDVITLDIKPACNPGVHIVADLTKPLPYIQNIKRIYLERPETFLEGDHGTTNTVVLYLKNLLPILPSHHPVTIEWEPCLLFIWPHTARFCGKGLEAELGGDDKHNPFTGRFNGSICLNATEYAINPTLVRSDISSFAQEKTALFQEAINMFLTHYEKEGIGSRAALHKRLQLEMNIIKQKAKYHPCDVFIKTSTSKSIETFNAHVKDVIIVEQPQQKHKGKRNKAQHNSVYCINLINSNKTILTKNTVPNDYCRFQQENSLFDFLWADIAVCMNKKYALACLEEVGLYNVHMGKSTVTSDVNFRKNVWLMSGLKKPAQDDIILDVVDAEYRQTFARQ